MIDARTRPAAASRRKRERGREAQHDRARHERRQTTLPDAAVHRRLREAADRRRPERLVLGARQHARGARATRWPKAGSTSSRRSIPTGRRPRRRPRTSRGRLTPANPGYSPEPDVAIVSLATHTGAIRTMLSGRDYQKDQLNTRHDAAPAGVVVQTLRAGGRVRGGDPADRDLLGRAGRDRRAATTPTAAVERDQRRGHEPRLPQPVRRDGGFGERGVRAADRRRRPRRTWSTWRTAIGITTPLPAGLRARDRLGRDHPAGPGVRAIRPSRTAGSTASRTRSPRSAAGDQVLYEQTPRLPAGGRRADREPGRPRC